MIAARVDIEAYLQEVDLRLPGSPAERREVLDELRDGLQEAIHAKRVGGLREVDAVPQAIAEFGPAEDLGAAMARELGSRIAIRVARRIIMVILVAGAAWFAFRAIVGAPWAAAPSVGLGALVFPAATLSLKVMAGLAQLSALAVLSLSTRPTAPLRPISLLSMVTMLAVGICLVDVTVIAVAVSRRARVDGMAHWRSRGRGLLVGPGRVHQARQGDGSVQWAMRLGGYPRSPRLPSACPQRRDR